MKLYPILLIGFIALLSCTKDQLNSISDDDNISITLPNGLVGTTIYVSLYDQTQGKFIASKAKNIAVINDTCSFKVSKNTTYKVYASNAIGLIHSSFASVDPTSTLYKTNSDIVGSNAYISKCSTNIISGESDWVSTNGQLTYANVEIKSRLCSLRVNILKVYKSVSTVYFLGTTMVPSNIVPDTTPSNQSTKYLYEEFTKIPRTGEIDYYDYALDMMFVPPSNGSMSFRIYDKFTTSDILLKQVNGLAIQPNNIYILNYTMTYNNNTFTISPYGRDLSQRYLELVSMDVLPQTLDKQ